MTDDKQDNPDIYAISKLSTPVQTVFTPLENSDIFAIKKENTERLGSLIGMALSAGVFLCTAYRLDRRIFHDEMGEIWKASDLKASRNVNIYLPPPEIRKNESATAPIRQTAKRVEALDHPRIVPVFGNFTDPEHGFLTVQKCINGKPLDVYRQEYTRRHKRFPQTTVIKIVSGIAHALDYAHGVDIIHGDLLPKNITVGSNGEVYVDNFALLPVQAETASAERKPYLSPEIIGGLAATVYTDVYALAVMTYELFSGRLPYSPETMNDVPLPIPNVPSTVDAVIRKALARDPEDRYDSCGDFVRALETGFRGASKNRPVAASPPTKKGVRKKRVVRHVLSSAALFALLLMGIGVGGGIVFLALPKESQEQWLAFLQRSVNDTASVLDEPTPSPPEPPPASKEDHRPKPELLLTHVAPLLADPPPEPEENVTLEPEPDVLPADHPPSLPEPIVDPVVELPNESVFSAIPERPPSVYPVGIMREEGTRWIIIANNIEYRFRWCTPLPNKAAGFWIQETMVTPDMWRTVMGTASVREQPSFGNGVPVRCVSWQECRKFIDTLNRSRLVDGEGFKGWFFSLPEEMQWKYAHGKDFFVLHEQTLEWCSDLFDGTGNRIVRGSDDLRNGHDPRLWYDHVGFRLVIVQNVAE